jgi:hypothetical protein
MGGAHKEAALLVLMEGKGLHWLDNQSTASDPPETAPALQAMLAQVIPSEVLARHHTRMFHPILMK